jgi:nuclear receptor subfamily 1 group I
MFQSSGMSGLLLIWTGRFVVERNAWLTSYGEISVPLMISAMGHEDTANQIISFMRQAKSLLKKSEVLFALVQILTFFQPGDSVELDQQAVSMIHDKYMLLLKHYLQSQYSFKHADAYFRAVMTLVAELKYVEKLTFKFMADFYQDCPQLITEISNYTPSKNDGSDSQDSR